MGFVDRVLDLLVAHRGELLHQFPGCGIHSGDGRLLLYCG
jgi:hypothetical protein